MRTSVKYLKRIAAVTFALALTCTAVFADGEATEVYLNGPTYTAAGDFVITGTDEVYQYQGEEFQVYNVYYDNPEHNMKIAVRDEGNCKSFIAFTDEYWIMYNCTKDGFGVRKVMFNNPNTRDVFNPEAYQGQTVLVKTRRIDKEQALGLIAAYMPKLQS